MALNDRDYMREPQNNSNRSRTDNEIFRKHMEEIKETKIRNANRNKNNEYKNYTAGNEQSFLSGNIKGEIKFIGNLYKMINKVHIDITDFTKTDIEYSNAFKASCEKENISCAISNYREKTNNEEHCLCIVYTKDSYYYIDCKWKIIANTEDELDIYYDKSKKDFINFTAQNTKPKERIKVKRAKQSKFLDSAAVSFLIALVILAVIIVIIRYLFLPNVIDKRENSRRLLTYQYHESADEHYFSYRIVDPTLVMGPTVEQEIMRIKREVNSQLIYGKSDCLPVKWLNKFSRRERKYAKCDDFAYLFWEKSQGSVILKDKVFFAITDDEVFGHAFNIIWIDGEWRAIEPQNMDRTLDLSGIYANLSEEAFNKWREKQRVMIFDVGDFNYPKAVVPLLK